MSGRYDDRPYHEEVYIERRHSESPSRKVAPPHFAPIYYGERPDEYQRGRSSISSQGSSSSRRHRDAELIRYEERHSRSHSIDSNRSHSSRRSSRQPSHSNNNNNNAVGTYIAPCSADCADAPARRRSSADKAKKPISHPLDEDSDYDSVDETERQKKARNKQLLYTGLAAITTIAATNNIYQSSKAHKARAKEVNEGIMCESEAKSKRNKALAMDLFSVGVGAICVNNAVNGWKKTKVMRAEEEARRERWERHERDARRRQSMVSY